MKKDMPVYGIMWLNYFTFGYYSEILQPSVDLFPWGNGKKGPMFLKEPTCEGGVPKTELYC